MRDTGAIFGGEHSAHYYFRDFFGADNGMLAALHVVAELAGSTLPLSQLAAQYARYVESGEINSVVTDQQAVVGGIERHFQDRAEIDHLDGLTITSTDGAGFWWFNVRASNTEPLLRLNVEASDRMGMERIRDEVVAIIRA